MTACRCKLSIERYSPHPWQGKRDFTIKQMDEEDERREKGVYHQMGIVRGGHWAMWAAAAHTVQEQTSPRPNNVHLSSFWVASLELRCHWMTALRLPMVTLFSIWIGSIFKDRANSMIFCSKSLHLFLMVQRHRRTYQPTHRGTHLKIVDRKLQIVVLLWALMVKP